VSADISSGKVVLLTGIRGSGRSALLDALIGLVPVSSGDIILGGRPLAEHNTLELRRRVAYLSEDDTVLPLSLRENVLLGTSGGDDVALRALELAGLDLALDTVMGNARMLDESIAKDIGRGARERVCGARAFARLLAGGARLVLVDGLRGKGIEEGALVKRILTHRAGATVIIVSDSPGNLGEQADQILCMDKGKIVQQGKHEDLLRDDGVYARLCGAQ
ncbi:P-loop containing nucleoside triphosphate hydrolase protein, partial [Schizophyllum fasciatum]